MNLSNLILPPFRHASAGARAQELHTWLTMTSMCWLASAPLSAAGQAVIIAHADRPGHAISRYLTGACIEDVNHEICGGIFSQMIFGESFQEPAPSIAPEGFRLYGGSWSVADGELSGSAGDGPKAVSESPAFADGEVSVEVFFDDRAPGNAGLIVRVARTGIGADHFDGYEVSLDPAAQVLRLGRHRHDWTHIRDVPCEVPVGRWIPLIVKLSGQSIEALVAGRSVLTHDDGAAALPAGTVGVRQWQRQARYRALRARIGDEETRYAFERDSTDDSEVSGMWRIVRRGGSSGRCSIETDAPFVGAQSQRITFAGGDGQLGIENRGLNRWGMHFAGGKPYEGVVWARAEAPVELWVAIESADGATVHAERPLALSGGEWQRLEFALSSPVTAPDSRFAVTLRAPGSVVVGYALLQPGAWGRFKGLPVRRDVAEGLIDQGITVLRYGGSMINHPEYRWKRMIGPRDRRTPTAGTWYPYSSNGWGILDFLDLCEAAGFLAIPAFNMGETPQDMADFIDYIRGTPETGWGRRRAADGHPGPYRLRHIQLGNEERVDEGYAAQFETIAEAIWAKAPDMILIVGDFAYAHPIHDPDRVTGAASRLTSLSGQRRILRFAQRHDREIWFDLHVGTDGPRPDSTLEGAFSYIDALERIADGARYKVVVFEFNAGNHTHRRALANALAIQALERDGRIPIATSANCLQPDGQNDNGWDQGLLFLDASRVWLQPPGWVTRMISRSYQPIHAPVTVAPAGALEVTAKRSEDASTLVLLVVNPRDEPVEADIRLEGLAPLSPTATVESLCAPLDAANTAARPDGVTPHREDWPHGAAGGAVRRTFPERSVTVVTLRTTG